ncbi:MAG: response regulator [Chloroflexi bacterium]|nr:response regulator [Chloroflexota bacterium]
MPAKILLVDNDLATLTWLKSKLENEGFDVATANAAQDALSQIEERAPTVVVFEVALPDLDGLEFLRRVIKNPPMIPPWMMILSRKNQPADILAGLEAGADDYVGKRPGADVELIGKIRGHLAHPRKPAVEAQAKQGRLLSFCSSKGGTGATSICVNIAFALAQLDPNSRILVVDMVLPLGTVGLSLGCESRRTVARVTQEMTDPVDRALIDKAVSLPLKWGFRVLLGAHDPQESTELNVSHIVPLFQTLRGMFDYILVDFGRTLSRISLPVIEMSDRIFLIVTPDIATLKGAKVMMDYMISRDVAQQQIFLINNRTVGRVWTTTEDIERELSMKVNATIPYVAEYMTMAINAAVPFMEKFPDHAASAMFRQIAQTAREQLKNGK